LPQCQFPADRCMRAAAQYLVVAHLGAPSVLAAPLFNVCAGLLVSSDLMQAAAFLVSLARHRDSSAAAECCAAAARSRAIRIGTVPASFDLAPLFWLRPPGPSSH
jgi:hypothetical protein